jgi:hypothetical protein
LVTGVDGWLVSVIGWFLVGWFLVGWLLVLVVVWLSLFDRIG